MVGISEVCQRGLKEYFDVDFGNTEEFENLKNDALQHRNSIIHGENLKSIDEETCKKGLKAVEIAMEYLTGIIFLWYLTCSLNKFNHVFTKFPND